MQFKIGEERNNIQVHSGRDCVDSSVPLSHPLCSALAALAAAGSNIGGSRQAVADI